MQLPPKLTTAFKGVCMGIADVIPGVSGGTLALILGIYTQFIESIRSVNLRPLMPGLRWVASGFNADRKQPLMDALATINLGFLVPLGIGIGSALALGSAIIPSLLERYPELMRGLFFGLIMASVLVPYRLIPKDKKSGIALAAILAVAFGVAGYWVTDPNTLMDTTSEWVTVTSPAAGEPFTLKEVTRRGPSALTAEQVYWSPENAPLRRRIASENPAAAAELATLHHDAVAAVATDKRALKARAEPYNALLMPPSTPVQVPRPSFAFVFIAGTIAICAMALPGISGSFLLLIMGVYYFILNAIKGSLVTLAGGEFPTESLLFVVLFGLGMVTGLATISRILSYLLRKHPAGTMGALTGLMIGCMRGVWPFQGVEEGQLINYVPAAWGPTELLAVVAAVIGVLVVTGLTLWGSRLEAAAREGVRAEP